MSDELRSQYTQPGQQRLSEIEKIWRSDPSTALDPGMDGYLPSPVQELASRENLKIRLIGIENGRAYFWTDAYRPGLRRDLLVALVESGYTVESVHLRAVKWISRCKRLHWPYRWIHGVHGILENGEKRELSPDEKEWCRKWGIGESDRLCQVPHCYEITPVPNLEKNWALRVKHLVDDLLYIRRVYANFHLRLIGPGIELPWLDRVSSREEAGRPPLGYNGWDERLTYPFHGFIACVLDTERIKMTSRIRRIWVIHPGRSMKIEAIWRLAYRWRRRQCTASSCTGFHRVLTPLWTNEKGSVKKEQEIEDLEE